MKHILFISLLFLVGCGGGGGGAATPEVSISPETVTSLVVGTTQTFDANATPVGETTFEWSADRGDVGAGNTAQITYTAPSTPGEDTLSVTTGTGATDTLPLDILEAQEDLEAVADPDTALVTDITLAAGAVQNYIIQIPEGLSESLLYIELETDNSLTLSAGDYFSTDPGSFSDENPAAGDDEEGTGFVNTQATTTQNINVQGIGAPRVCRGPCIILNNDATSYPIAVTNTGDAAATFSLYAYDAEPVDSGEPENDNCSVDLGDLILLDVPLTPGAADGAIETIDDVDCYEEESEERVSIIFSAPDTLSIPLIAEIFNADEPGLPPTTIEIEPGRTAFSDCGAADASERIVIAVRANDFVAGAELAGPSANTNYSLEISDTLPAEFCSED